MMIVFLFLVSIIVEINGFIVTRVIDGDSIVLETGEKVRLIGIDSPEIGEAFGYEAKVYLEKLIIGKRITIRLDNTSDSIDFYKRKLAYVYFDSIDINLEMIKNGYAKVFRKYDFDNMEQYIYEEEKAKQYKVGIWNGNLQIEKNVEIESSNKTKGDENIENSDSNLFKLRDILLIAIFIALVFPLFYYYLKKGD